MLKALVPRGRTHRLSVVVASMLEYASHCIKDGDDGGTTSETLMAVRDGSYGPEESIEKIVPFIDTLFSDAGVKAERINSKSHRHSIANSAAYQFLSWHNMPWED